MKSQVIDEPSAITLEEPKVSKQQRLNQKYAVSPGSAGEAALVEQHLSLVKHVVARLAMNLPQHIDSQDLYSSGLVGLLNAIRNYDPEAGSSFESYARVRIRGAIFDELRRLDWIPRSVHDKARKVQVIIERLEQSLGRTPSDGELAKALDLSMEDFEELMSEIRPATFVCLDAISGQDDDRETNKHEIVADQVQDTPDVAADRRELARIVAERLEKLPEMQRKVLALYYFEDLRLREIAEVLGVTESRICQIHSQAILAIKAFLRNKAGVTC